MARRYKHTPNFHSSLTVNQTSSHRLCRFKINVTLNLTTTISKPGEQHRKPGVCYLSHEDQLTSFSNNDDDTFTRFPDRLELRFRQQRGLLGCQLKRGFLSFEASSRKRRGATLVAIVCRREADKRGRVLRKKKRKSGANFRSRKPVAMGNLLSTHTCSFCIKTSKMTQHRESRA